ncbi:MAG: type II toxin-antitoxin system HicB family antitoxin [Deltaproteobacteria bacterium]|jgi:predicted RNase H-like HicB family nuclease|nr:type II toxin-antitoxin system HicB family antitoxin [Deltaproteobacteria bacterium]
MKKTYWTRFFACEGIPGYTAQAPDLDFNVTEGDSWDEAIFMAKDMITGWLEICLRDGVPLPEARSYEDVRSLEVPEGIESVSLVEISVDLGLQRPMLPEAIWADLAKFSQKEGLPVGEILARAAREFIARHT